MLIAMIVIFISLISSCRNSDVKTTVRVTVVSYAFIQRWFSDALMGRVDVPWALGRPHQADYSAVSLSQRSGSNIIYVGKYSYS